MKLINLFIIFHFFTIGSFKPIDQKKLAQSSIQLIISSEKDTILIGGEMIINASIANGTNKAILIPKNFVLTSNLYPNSISNHKPFSGGLFDLKISPASEWAKIFIEDLAIKKENEFLTVKSDSTMNFKIDVGEHINSFNNDIKDDSLRIKGGHTYTLQLTYSNKINGIKNVFSGSIDSNKIMVFIKK
jgi:hypothetical protein